MGSGPIVIGQACEFDYSGTQGAKALKEEGYEVVLVNSNPATVMTDPEFADRTYVEPLDAPGARGHHRARAPGRDAAHAGRADRAQPRARARRARRAREVRRRADRRERRGHQEGRGSRAVQGRDGEDRPALPDARSSRARSTRPTRRSRRSATRSSCAPRSRWAARAAASPTPRPSSTPRFAGRSSRAPRTSAWSKRACSAGRSTSSRSSATAPTTSSVICTIENFDPMGVHTGDSITVAPAMTLTDKEYQRLRDAGARDHHARSASTRAARTSSSASIPKNGDIVVIEMNPRVSRSSALASKATGYPDREDRRQARRRLHARRAARTTSPARAPRSSRPSTTWSPRCRASPSRSSRAPTRASTTQMKSVGEVDGDRPHLQGGASRRPRARSRSVAPGWSR